MNIDKKTMLLMALCCSLGAPLSAVENSHQLQDQNTTPKHSKNVQDFKKEIQKTVKETKDFIKDFVDKDAIPFNDFTNGITKLEKLESELTIHKDGIRKATENIENSGYLLKKENRSQMDILDTLLSDVTQSYNTVRNARKDTLEVLKKELSNEPGLQTIKKLLEEANKEESLVKLLKDINEKKYKHQKLIDEAEKAVYDDDSEGEIKKTIYVKRQSILESYYFIIGRIAFDFIKAIDNELTKLDTKLDREIYRDTNAIDIIESDIRKSDNVKRQRLN